ncbi:unnamed protein product [Closterium sp. NIES-54]
MDCGLGLSTDPETRDILLHYTTTRKSRKQIGRAHSDSRVYILDFDIPDCSGDSQELIDLVLTRTGAFARQKSFAKVFSPSHAGYLPGADGKKRRAPPMKGGGEALADGAQVTLTDGELQLAATLADGAPHLAVRQAVGALPEKVGEHPVRTKGGKSKKRNRLLFLLVALRAALPLHFLHLTSSRIMSLGTPSTRKMSPLPHGVPSTHLPPSRANRPLYLELSLELILPSF